MINTAVFSTADSKLLADRPITQRLGGPPLSTGGTTIPQMAWSRGRAFSVHLSASAPKNGKPA